MWTDLIINGQGQGDLAEVMDIDNGSGVRFDTGLLRPYFASRKSDGRSIPVCSVDTGRKETRNNAKGEVICNSDGTAIDFPIKEVVEVKDLIDAGVESPVFNATTLTKDQWVRFDRRVQAAVRQRLRAWSDLASRNSLGGFDGMSSTILEYETMTDDGEAIVDMDALTEGRTDHSEYTLKGIPLPITHSDFFLSKRVLQISRKSGRPQSTVRAEAAARRVAETIEKTLIGTVTGAAFGTAATYGGTRPQVKGYTNHGQRITKTDLTASGSFVADTFVNEVLAMRELAYAQNFFGPFICYVSTAYDAKLDQDYVTGTAAQGLSSPNSTVRSRTKMIDGITDVRRLDYLTGDVVLLVQMTPDVVEAINGMNISTVQWESVGGMRTNFKVMGIQVPFIKDFPGGSTGIVHGTTS